MTALILFQFDNRTIALEVSCRAAAARFGVAPSTAIRWQAPRRATGSFAAKPQGGDMETSGKSLKRAFFKGFPEVST